jgi:hypothetical protein
MNDKKNTITQYEKRSNIQNIPDLKKKPIDTIIQLEF